MLYTAESPLGHRAGLFGTRTRVSLGVQVGWQPLVPEASAFSCLAVL